MTESSPRTAAEPFAFTRTEFWNGALSAWLWFLLLASVAWMILLGPYAGVAALYVVPWSMGATLVFATPAHFLGRALRRDVRTPVHLAAFAALGAVVGAATTVLLFAVDPSLQQAMGATVIAVNLATSTIAVPVGWWRAARRALRSDADPRDSGAVDPDAAAEDALLDADGSAR